MLQQSALSNTTTTPGNDDCCSLNNEWEGKTSLHNDGIDGEERMEKISNITSENTYWKPMVSIPHVSNIESSFDSGSLPIANNVNGIEKQCKLQRLLHDNGKLSNTLSNNTIRMSTHKPFFIPFKDCGRKPPSIKEERRRARARYQIQWLDHIRNQSISTTQSIVQRKLIFEN